MKKLCMIFVAFLGACGGSDHGADVGVAGGDGDTTQTIPSVDPFFSAVEQVVATTSEDMEPIAIDAITATAPEDGEPAALN